MKTCPTCGKQFDGKPRQKYCHRFCCPSYLKEHKNPGSGRGGFRHRNGRRKKGERKAKQKPKPFRFAGSLAEAEDLAS